MTLLGLFRAHIASLKPEFCLSLRRFWRYSASQLVAQLRNGARLVLNELRKRRISVSTAGAPFRDSRNPKTLTKPNRPWGLLLVLSCQVLSGLHGVCSFLRFLGPVDIPPWNLQRPERYRSVRLHGWPGLVFAPQVSPLSSSG